MRKFQVVMSVDAKVDLYSLLDYMKYKLCNPTAAYRKSVLIDKALGALAEHPYWQHAYLGNPWQGQNIYIYCVDNYKILHIPDEKKKQTTVIRVLHKHQDIETQLAKMEK